METINNCVAARDVKRVQVEGRDREILEPVLCAPGGDREREMPVVRAARVLVARRAAGPAHAILDGHAHAQLRDLAEEQQGPVAYVAMNFVHHLTNFRRLVCGCMDSYDSEQSHILQHFSSSTRFAYFAPLQS